MLCDFHARIHLLDANLAENIFCSVDHEIALCEKYARVHQLDQVDAHELPKWKDVFVSEFSLVLVIIVMSSTKRTSLRSSSIHVLVLVTKSFSLDHLVMLP